MAAPNPTSNFQFLAEHDPLFVQLGEAAERAFASDPNSTLIKLRQLGHRRNQRQQKRSNSVSSKWFSCWGRSGSAQ